MFCFECIKINKIVNKFLLAGNKFIPEIHLKQPGFIYSAWDPFTKSRERIEKFMQTGNTDFIYRNELDKFYFSMIWLMVNQKIQQKELSQTKFEV